jgi:hypothetical protein
VPPGFAHLAPQREDTSHASRSPTSHYCHRALDMSGKERLSRAVHKAAANVNRL